MIALYFLHKRHPVNFLLLTLFTIAIAFSVGLSCAYTKGILPRAIPTFFSSLSWIHCLEKKKKKKNNWFCFYIMLFIYHELIN